MSLGSLIKTKDVKQLLIKKQGILKITHLLQNVVKIYFSEKSRENVNLMDYI